MKYGSWCWKPIKPVFRKKVSDYIFCCSPKTVDVAAIDKVVESCCERQFIKLFSVISFGGTFPVKNNGKGWQHLFLLEYTRKWHSPKSEEILGYFRQSPAEYTKFREREKSPERLSKFALISLACTYRPLNGTEVFHLFHEIFK